jgi:radical SAM protein with 4Fe4S-binding SPASM domain
MGFITGVLTNGILIDDKTLRRLKRAAGRNLILIFGINSINDKQLNIQTRNINPGRILKAMELCHAHKIKRHVVINVGSFNLHDLEDTLDWLTRNRLSFNRAPFNPRNSGRAWFETYGYTREDIREIIHPALRKRINGYTSQTPFFLSPEVYTELSGDGTWNKTIPQNPTIGCWCGSWISVNPEGDVAPCPLLQDELVAGNIRHQNLFDIVDSSPIFQNLMNRKLLKGRCGRCRYRLTCGGCRALAYYHMGDYLEEDPTCPFEPENETTVSPFEDETNKLFRQYIRLSAWAGLYKPGYKNHQETKPHTT